MEVINTLFIPVEGKRNLYSKYLIAKNKRSNKMGLIFGESKVVIPYNFDDIEICSNKFCRVKDNSKENFGLYDLKGKEIFSPDHDLIEVYNSTFILVRKENKCSILDLKLNIIITMEYDYIKIINDNLFIVKKDNKMGLVNLNNEVVLNLQYDNLENIRFLFSKGYIVGINGKVGVLDEEFNLVLPIEYDAICEFGFSIIARKEDTNYFFNSKGEEENPSELSNERWNTRGDYEFMIDKKFLYEHF